MVLLAWAVIIGAALVFFFWASGLIKQDQENERFDAGLAIVEFGRAYPMEAIRNVIISADGEMVFLRLWTGLTGCMRRNGSRFLCHVIDPAEVRVNPSVSGKALDIDFGAGLKILSGNYEFRSQREAAEVSLWILGSFTAKAETELHMPSHA